MTVKCKHGTEVYKFRCPECADERRVAAHKSLEASEGRLSKIVDNFDNADGRTHDVSELISPVGDVSATDAEDRAKFLRPHVDRHKHKSATDMVCDVADIDWLLDEVDTLRRCNRLNLANLAASEKENALLKGAMAADDERLRNAEKRIYPDVTWGCDAAEHMADLVIGLRSELADLRAKVPQATQSDTDCATRCIQIAFATNSTTFRAELVEELSTAIAANIAPIRAQLETAVGHVRELVKYWGDATNDADYFRRQRTARNAAGRFLATLTTPTAQKGARDAH